MIPNADSIEKISFSRIDLPKELMTAHDLNVPLTVADIKALLGTLTDDNQVTLIVYPLGKERCIEISAGGNSIYLFQASSL